MYIHSGITQRTLYVRRSIRPVKYLRGQPATTYNIQTHMCLCITPQILYAQRSIRPVKYLRSQQLTTYHIRIHMYLCITPQILYAKRLICPVKCLRIQFVTVNTYICMYTYLCLCYSSRTLCAMIVAHRVYFCLKRQHITICTYICIHEHCSRSICDDRHTKWNVAKVSL